MSPLSPTPVEDAVIGEPPADSAEELLALHRMMVFARAFELEVVDAAGKQLVPGTTHPGIAQEGCKVGAVAALRPDDQLLATYRGHVEALAKGCDPVATMAEIMARATGLNAGKGGSMHLSDPERGLVMTNAIVAGHLPIAGGVALACKHRNTGQVVLAVFGDGAACEGEFFETLNMAKLWSVPLIFLCENNGWAITVPTSLSQATPDIADRARGFGIPAEIVDGNDVLAVRDAVAAAGGRARAGEGPQFIECKTVRWERHSAFTAFGDPDEMRRAWQSVDPIERFERRLVAWSVATEEELKEIRTGEEHRAAAVRAEAEAAPLPGPGSWAEHVYSTPAG